MHPALLCSSILSGLVHISILKNASFPRLPSVVYGAGIFTSIVNHGWPRNHILPIVQSVDRAVIFAAACYDMNRAWEEEDPLTQVSLLGLQYAAVKSFATAKRFGGRGSTNAIGTLFHIGSHTLITCNHVLALKDNKNIYNSSDFSFYKKPFQGCNILSQVAVPDKVVKSALFSGVGLKCITTTKRAWLR